MRWVAVHSTIWNALLLVGGNAFSTNYYRSQTKNSVAAKPTSSLKIFEKKKDLVVLHSYFGAAGDDNNHEGSEESEEKQQQGGGGGGENEIWFDDFGDFVIGDGNTNYNNGPVNDESESLLQQRIREQQQQDLKRETRLLQNWKQGDWSVRGFSLDPTDAINEAVSENQSFFPDEPQQQQQAGMANTPTPIAPIHISKVVPDANSDGTRVWVGRSNGSLVWVKLGTEATTHFTSKIRGRFIEGDDGKDDDDDDDSPSSMAARFGSELVRDPGRYPPFGGGGGGGPNFDNNEYDDLRQQRQQQQQQPQQQDPFQVLAQFSPASSDGSSISTILSVPDEDCIFTACEGSGQIQQWHISEDDVLENNNNNNNNPALQTPLALSEGIHNDAIVALKTVLYQESPLLLSVSADGVMALWDIPKGDLIFHCQISIDEIIVSETPPPPAGEQQDSPSFESATANINQNQPPPPPSSRVLLCADSDANHIFLGTASGYVLGYDVTDLLLSASSGGTCPLPQGKFKAHEVAGGVTAIACGGPGSLGRLGGGSSSSDGKTSSTVLITGGMDGQVKQWEILSSPSMQKMENWPKISTQRLPKKAHIFEGHNGPITALESMGGRKPQFLSASEDGTIRAWDVAKGTENYRMEGFTKDLSSLCLLGSSDSDDDFLVTNGMNQYVCVHDFSQGIAGESIDDFLDPWDGEP